MNNERLLVQRKVARRLLSEPPQTELARHRRMLIERARAQHFENLRILRATPHGARNNMIFEVAFFAGRLYAAGILDDEPGVKGDIARAVWQAAHHLAKEPENKDIILDPNPTISGGWEKGLDAPFTIGYLKDPEIEAVFDEEYRRHLDGSPDAAEEN